MLMEKSTVNQIIRCLVFPSNTAISVENQSNKRLFKLLRDGTTLLVLDVQSVTWSLMVFLSPGDRHILQHNWLGSGFEYDFFLNKCTDVVMCVSLSAAIIFQNIGFLV